MERNANFDYRNFFFPGPAFPMQLYPMSGNSRFPLPSSFGPGNVNDLTPNMFPTVSGDNITEEVVRPEPQGRSRSPRVAELSSPPHALVKTRNTTMSLTPLQVEEALQGLERQLDKAIAFCEKSLDKHSQVVKSINSHAKKDARNSLWRGLLESRFDASDSDRDLFHNFSGRLVYCTQQVRDAASADPSAKSTSHGKRREFERLVLKVNQISAICDKIVNLSQKALDDTQTCEDMVAEMKTLKGLCKGYVGSLEKSDDGEGGNLAGDNFEAGGEAAAAGQAGTWGI